MKEEIKEVVNSVVEVAGKVDKNTVDTIMGKLELMASGLGTTTEYLWGVVIKQAHVTMCYDFILLGAFILIGIGYAVFLQVAFKNKFFTSRAIGYDEDSRQVITIIITIVFGVSMVVLLIVSLADIIPELLACCINPEYWAFETICKKIR